MLTKSVKECAKRLCEKSQDFLLGEKQISKEKALELAQFVKKSYYEEFRGRTAEFKTAKGDWLDQRFAEAAPIWSASMQPLPTLL